MYRQIIADQIFADDNDLYTSRSDIFLYATPDHTIFFYVHWLRQEAGRYICHQDFSFGIWQFMIYCSINRIILANVYIICIIINRKIRAIRNISKCLIFGRSNLFRFSVFLSFLIRFLCPLTCHDIISYTVFHQVHRNCGKL